MRQGAFVVFSNVDGGYVDWIITLCRRPFNSFSFFMFFFSSVDAFSYFFVFSKCGRRVGGLDQCALPAPLQVLCGHCGLVIWYRFSEILKIQSSIVASNSKNTRALTFETQKSVRLYWAKLESCLFVVNRTLSIKNTFYREQNTFYGEHIL